MKRFTLMMFICLCCSSARLFADSIPSVDPSMTVVVDGTEQDYAEYSGSAPIVAHFYANPESLGTYQPIYEWRVYLSGQENEPYIIRYQQNMDYVFSKAEVSYIALNATFISGTDTIRFQQDEPFSIAVSTSKLEIPNAFSPNGDGVNDIFKVKDNYESIIDFHGYIFNRWGKKIYEWTDITSGWDGTINGSPAPEGVYFCQIRAKGSEGKIYNLRGDVNLLRKYITSP